MTTPRAVPLAAAASLWEPTPTGPYLNTATFGLPPRPTLEAVRDALEDWRRGEDAARRWTDAPGWRCAPCRSTGWPARSTPPRAAGGCRWTPPTGTTWSAPPTSGCSPRGAAPSWRCGPGGWRSWHPSARRLDLSPAWFSWVGAVPSLEVVERIGVAAIGEHDVALANRLRAGVRAAVRDGGVRVSCHLYNTPQDVDTALDALGC